jgi:hypothetical protein
MVCYLQGRHDEQCMSGCISAPACEDNIKCKREEVPGDTGASKQQLLRAC